MSAPTWPIRDRRRRDVGGRVARLSFPVREAFGDFVAGFPCNLIGHDFWEVPPALRRSIHNPNPERMRFRCRRCGMMSGGSN